ncbi:MAG: YbjN domain-containing protein [Pseudomonadota bacterium]
MKSYSAMLGAVALGFAAVSGAQAQNQLGSGQSSVGNPTTIVQKFSVQTVGPVLNELGMPWQVKQLDNGAQYIHAASGSMQFILFFTVCTGSDCSGMQAITFFGDSNANPQTVQAFNSRYPFGTAGLDQSGTAYVSRYDIADFGIPRGNVASSLINFLQLAEMFSNELANAHQTVSLDGYADDLSSSHLNRKSLGHFSGVDVSLSNQSKQHRDGFEQGAEMIRLLLDDESAPRNKIQNTLD